MICYTFRNGELRKGISYKNYKDSDSEKKGEVVLFFDKGGFEKYTWEVLGVYQIIRESPEGILFKIFPGARITFLGEYDNIAYENKKGILVWYFLKQSVKADCFLFDYKKKLC